MQRREGGLSNAASPECDDFVKAEILLQLKHREVLLHNAKKKRDSKTSVHNNKNVEGSYQIIYGMGQKRGRNQ